MAGTPESKIKNRVKKDLDSLEAYYFLTNLPSGFSKKGLPDIVACLPLIVTKEMIGLRLGVFAGIEVKADYNELSALQKLQLKKIQAAGGKGYLVKGENVQEIA